MSHSSATGGYLSQTNTFVDDDSLTNAIQELVAGVTGIGGALVRPRWQLNPPRQPEPAVDWVAVGITRRRAIDYPYMKHANGGPTTLTRWTTLDVLASFHGPHAQRYAEQMRDALHIAQNFEHLNTLGVRFHDGGPEIVAVPELTNQQWVNRADLTFTLVQQVARDYNILDIASSSGTISADDGVSSTFNVNP